MKIKMLIVLGFSLICSHSFAQFSYSFNIKMDKAIKSKQQISVLKANETFTELNLGKEISVDDYIISKVEKEYLMTTKSGKFIAKINNKFTKIMNENNEIIAQKTNYGSNKVVWKNGQNLLFMSDSEFKKGNVKSTVFMNRDVPEFAYIALIERLKYSKDVILSNLSAFI